MSVCPYSPLCSIGWHQRTVKAHHMSSQRSLVSPVSLRSVWLIMSTNAWLTFQATYADTTLYVADLTSCYSTTVQMSSCWIYRELLKERPKVTYNLHNCKLFKEFREVDGEGGGGLRGGRGWMSVTYILVWFCWCDHAILCTTVWLAQKQNFVLTHAGKSINRLLACWHLNYSMCFRFVMWPLTVAGKGRGRQVIAVARTADVILMMLDASKGDVQRRLLEKELESVGIRLNKKPPNIYFKVGR